MSPKKLSQKINEDDVLALLKDTFSQREDLLNDGAVLACPSKKSSDHTIVCTDNLVEGIHYQATDTPETVANLLLTRVVSDQAASGAMPYAITLNFILSADMTPSYLSAMLTQLNALCADLNICLLGGDTSITPASSSSFSITCFGTGSRILRRDLAVDGQLVYVTGFIGDAFAAHKINMKCLTSLSEKGTDYYHEHATRFTPRVHVMQVLDECIDCAIDISDGLLLDAHKLGSASSKVITLFHDDIPISPEMQEILSELPKTEAEDLRNQSLSWGGDYEVLFTTYATNAARIEETMNTHNVPLTCIGYVAKSQPATTQFVSLRNDVDRDITPQKLGFTHGMGDLA